MTLRNVRGGDGLVPSLTSMIILGVQYSEQHMKVLIMSLSLQQLTHQL